MNKGQWGPRAECAPAVGFPPCADGSTATHRKVYHCGSERPTLQGIPAGHIQPSGEVTASASRRSSFKAGLLRIPTSCWPQGCRNVERTAVGCSRGSMATACAAWRRPSLWLGATVQGNYCLRHRTRRSQPCRWHGAARSPVHGRKCAFWRLSTSFLRSRCARRPGSTAFGRSSRPRSKEGAGPDSPSIALVVRRSASHLGVDGRVGGSGHV